MNNGQPCPPGLNGFGGSPSRNDDSPDSSSTYSNVPALSPPAVASLDAIDRLTDELDELSVDNVSIGQMAPRGRASGSL